MGQPNLNDGAFYSANLDGSDVATIVRSGEVHTPKQCVIDQQGKKLYFCDREGLRVMRVNFDGSALETQVQTADWKADKVDDQKYWCVGLAISNRLGRLFWSQKGPIKGNEGRIFSASLHLPLGESPSTRSDI